MKRKNTHIAVGIIIIGLLALACSHAGTRHESYGCPSAVRTSPTDSCEGCLECPTTKSGEHVIVYDGFTVSYNHTTLVPDWVAYQLTADELNAVYTDKSSRFSRDPNLKGRQAWREDYANSGWDKGHMAPKADLRWSEKVYWQSHYFTNVCPQDHSLNGKDWQRLEDMVRKWARKYGSVYIVCGPIFDSTNYRTIGERRVAIPDKFFKAVLVDNSNVQEAIAFVFSNDASHQPPQRQAMTVDSLETLIGRDLFPALDDNTEKRVEATTRPAFWFPKSR